MGKSEAIERARIIRKCLLKHGVPEVSIELQAGRPAVGDDWTACKPVGVLSHHTASHPTPGSPTPCLSLVKRGRSDLPGPLCNGYAGVDLVYRIITLGYANHSGEGGPLRLEGPVGIYTVPKDVGRPYLWGTEFEGGYDDEVWDRKYTHKKTGKSMTFREFMGRCNAGLVEAIWQINELGKTPSPSADLSGYHGEHLTWAPDRKIDRRNYTTKRGRTELRNYNEEEKKDYPPNFPGVKRVVLRTVQRAAKGKEPHPTPSVRRVQRALITLYGSDMAVDGTWGKKTTRLYKHHQKHIGLPEDQQDGIPGLKDLMQLGGHRWTVATN